MKRAPALGLSSASRDEVAYARLLALTLPSPSVMRLGVPLLVRVTPDGYITEVRFLLKVYPTTVVLRMKVGTYLF